MPDLVPLRARRLLGATLDDEEVVYDPLLRQAHLLNPTASLLLGRCDGHTPLATVVAELAGTFAAEPAAVEADVRLALADFATRHLVGPDPDEAAPPERPRPALVPLDEPTAVPDTWTVVSPVLRLLGCRARVRSDDAFVGVYVDTVLASLVDGVADAASEADEGAVHELDVVTAGPGPIRIRLDGEDVGAATTLDAALSFVHWQLNQLAIDGSDPWVLLHASAVRRGDRVAVFPAVSNSGKSTLAAGLVEAGFGYVSDEAVAIDPATGLVHAFPKPISLDPGSWELFAAYEPSLPGAPEPLFVHERHLDPRALNPAALAGLTDPTAAPRVALVAFPTYRAGAETRFEPLTRAAGLLALLEHSFNLADAGPAGVDALVRVAAEARVVRLSVGNLAAAVELIRTAL